MNKQPIIKQINQLTTKNIKKRKIDNDIPQYYSYKQDNYSCEYCKWKGLGSDTEMGDIGCDWNFMELLCPKCYELVGTVLFPTHDEVRKYGTDEEKKDLDKREEFIEKVNETRLKSSYQLVDIIDDDNIIIQWDHDEDSKEQYFLYKNVVLWKEKATYESYERFLEVGRILKQKYGNGLKDFVPTHRSTLYLYGDCIGSINIVKNFRNSLKK